MRRSTGQQPGTKSSSRHADNPQETAEKPIVKRGTSSSIGLPTIWLVRASGETFRRRVFDALEKTRVACLLGEVFCPTPPRRPAVRPDPTRSLYVRGFGLDK